MNDAALAQAWRDGGRAHGDGCPSLDEIEALHAGQLELSRRAAVLQALASCAECALLAQLSADVHAAAQQSVAALTVSNVVALPPRQPARQLSARAWPLALAASLLLAIGSVALLRPEPAMDVVRGVSPAIQTDPADGASLAAAPTQLRWSAPTGASRYVVELMDARADLIWRSPVLSAPEATLDADVQARLVPGEYLWRVRVDERSTLGPYRLVLAP